MLLLALLSPALAASPTVTVTVSVPNAQQLGLDEAEISSAMSEAFSSQLNDVDLKSYMDQMANANVLSAKGLGVDYASNMQRFAIGGGFGTAVNGAGFAFTSGGGLPETGFALQVGAMAGLNLGFLSPKESALRRFKIYLNGMTAKTKRDPFDATFLNYGAHLQIQMVKGGDKTAGVRWGGLDVTSGYEFSSYSLALNQPLPVDSGELSWDAEGTMVLSATAQSIPLELSTNLHIFVVTAFVGGGADYNLAGDSLASIGLGGDLSATYNGQTEDIGTASASISQEGVANTFTPRVFAGAQADIFMVKIYGQLNVTLDKSVGGHLGARVVF